MSEVECPCCAGSGKITIVSAPGRPSEYVTVRALAARVGRVDTTIQRHILSGILKAEVGEVLMPHRRRGRVVRQPRACYLIRRDEADRYAKEIEQRREVGRKSWRGRGVEMEKMHDQGHSLEVIAERFKVQVASVRQTLRRRRAK